METKEIIDNSFEDILLELNSLEFDPHSNYERERIELKKKIQNIKDRINALLLCP